MQGHDFHQAQAAKFRKMAEDCDPQTAQSLLTLADDYEAEALRLEQPADPPIVPPAAPSA